jgi:hypothetical protein
LAQSPRCETLGRPIIQQHPLRFHVSGVRRARHVEESPYAWDHLQRPDAGLADAQPHRLGTAFKTQRNRVVRSLRCPQPATTLTCCGPQGLSFTQGAAGGALQDEGILPVDSIIAAPPSSDGSPSPRRPEPSPSLPWSRVLAVGDGPIMTLLSTAIRKSGWVALSSPGWRPPVFQAGGRVFSRRAGVRWPAGSPLSR